MNKASKKDLQSAIAVILFAIAFYAFSFQIQPTTSDVLGSRFFPQAASIILILLGLVQAGAQSDLQRKTDRGGRSADRKE